MIQQRITYLEDGTAELVIKADTVGIGELAGIHEELKLRSTIRTEPTMHELSPRPPDPVAL